MSHGRRNWLDSGEDEPYTDRSLLGRMVEGVIIFAICCFLIKLGVSYLMSVKVPLIVISAILGTAVIIWRIYKRRAHDDY